MAVAKMHITTTVGLMMEMERRDLCIDPCAEGALKDWAFKHVLPEAAVETAPQAAVEAAPQAASQVFVEDEDELSVDEVSEDEVGGDTDGGHYAFAKPTPSNAGVGQTNDGEELPSPSMHTPVI